MKPITDKVIANIRSLIADIVEKAQSGHPGSALALTPLLTHLYLHMHYDPNNPKHPLRDIFVLSNAHACPVLYVMNYLVGNLCMKDLKEFRRINSKTPGHPEKSFFVELTSEPLGQGVAQSVGLALALKRQGLDRKVYCIFGDGCYQEGISQEAFSIANHLCLNNLYFVYDSNEMTIDGPTSLSMTEVVEERFKCFPNFEVHTLKEDFSESVMNWLSSDSNKVKVMIHHSVIGKGSKLEGENRTHGLPLGKEVIKEMKESHDLKNESFFESEELKEFKRELIKEKTREIDLLTKEKVKYIKEYYSQSEIKEHFLSTEFNNKKEDLNNKREDLNNKREDLNNKNDELNNKREDEMVNDNSKNEISNDNNSKNDNSKNEISNDNNNKNISNKRDNNSKNDNSKNNISKNNNINNKRDDKINDKNESKENVKENWEYFKFSNEFKEPSLKKSYEKFINDFYLTLKNLERKNSVLSTRKHFQSVLSLMPYLPQLILGSADLAQSLLLKDNTVDITKDFYSGNYLNFGVREHAMCAIFNGLSALGYICMGGTFLNFIHYCFTGIRSCCLDNLKVIYIFTHDSLLVGQDGPTHQPVEGLALLRSVPNLHVFRPCDEVEVRYSLWYALKRDGPSALVFTRQPVKPVSLTNFSLCEKGAYFLKRSSDYDLTIFTSGSEVPLCLDVSDLLQGKYTANVVSVLSFELFDLQSEEYKKEILGCKPRVSIELSSTFGWHKFGELVIGLERFGKSGSPDDLAVDFGFTPKQLVDRIIQWMDKK